MQDSKTVGILGEQVAHAYLLKRGYDILAFNYRKPWGEVDIVAKKRDILTFFEIKTNLTKYPYDFNPEIRADQKKLARVSRVAETFLHEHRMQDSMWQIDVLGITISVATKKAVVRHYRRAYSSP